MSLETEGFDGFEKLLVQIGEEFGYTEVNRRVLIPAAKKALQGLDAQAKAMARKDTGRMASTVTITSQKPTPKDMDSKYVDKDDAVIGILSVRLYKVSLGEEFGTANKAAHPFIIPTFEKNLASIEALLRVNLNLHLIRYRAKKTKDKPL